MTLHPIRSAADHEAALARAARLMDAAPGTPEADELDVLATLIARYEDEAVPVPPPDPIAAVLFRLEQAGRPPHDLREILGVSRGRLSELLNRKRRLTLGMIRTLARELGIPAAVLIGEEPAGVPGDRGGARPGRRGRAPRRAPGGADEPRGSAYPDEVAARLRADRALDPEAAELLGEMFRAAYERAAARGGW